MKNKLLKILTLIFSISLCLFALTACEHKHDFIIKKFDNINHWLQCECGEKANVENHLFNGEYLPNNDGTKSQSCECGIIDYIVDENVLIVENSTITEVTEYGKTLTEIVIPGSVESVGANIFKDCELLTKVTVQNGVEHLYASFNGAKSLKEVIIPESVYRIESFAFQNCPSLTNIEVAEENWAYKDINGNLYDKEGMFLIQYALGKSEETFIIPSGVKIVRDSAFRGSVWLKNVIISNSVTEILNYAFADSLNLTKIIIPSSVEGFGHNVFYNCPSLTIYCEAESMPETWSPIDVWNSSNRPIVWGYKSEN